MHNYSQITYVAYRKVAEPSEISKKLIATALTISSAVLVELT